MFLQLIIFFLAFVRGELREYIQPFVPTFVKFNGFNVEVDHQGQVTELVKKSGEDSGQKFTLALNVTNRGIFSRICNLNAAELKKVEIQAVKYSKNPTQPEMIDITRLYTDAKAYTEEESWSFGDIFTPIQDKTNITCQVMSLRGIIEVQMRVKEEISSPFTIEFTAEKWTLVRKIRVYFTFVAILPLIFAFVVCYLKGWFFCESLKRFQCCQNRHRALQNKLKAGEVSKIDKIQRWGMMILFNIDLLTDFQYVLTVPFQSYWMMTISILTLIFPIGLIVVPSFCYIIYGCALILIMVYKKENNKQKRSEIFLQYIWKSLLFAFYALFNGIQFLDRSLQERFEGNYNFQRNRILEREKEIDEEILKIDSIKQKKILHKNVIKQFKQQYPDDLTAVKDLQQDYTIFMKAWVDLSEDNKGYRIKQDNVVDFFQRIGQEQLDTLKISENDKRLKALEIKNQDGGAKKQLQSNYKFDERVNRVIGKGVMGEIYYATLKTDKQFEVAIQVVDKKVHAKSIEEFNENFKSMKALDHPNIAKYYESYEDEKRLYLVMEYFDDNGDIQNKFNAPPEDDDENENDADNQDENSNQREQMAYKLIKQLLSAINHMHSENLPHRDIRPENILMAKDDSLKLVDVQLLRIKDNSKMNQDADPYYTAPEDLNSASPSQDKTSDIWGIGVILYNLLSGKQPFDGEDNMEIEISILTQQVSFAYEEFQNVSEDAKELITKMLEKDPLKRITAEQALNHKWFNKENQEFDLEMQAFQRDVMKRLRKFKKRSMLKQMALFQLVDLLKQQDNVEEIQKLEEVFHRIDINNTTKITETELNDAYHQVGIKTSPDKIKMIIQEVDYMHNGSITITEFVCATLDVYKLSDDTQGEKMLKSIFHKFQKDNVDKEFITSDDIIFAWNNLGADYKITEQDMDEIFQQHDLSREGVVTWEEFTTIFKETGSKNIGKQIKNFYDTAKKEHGGEERDQNKVRQKIWERIKDTIKFDSDDGYIYYSEFIFKIFQFKYDKLNSNIFQIKAESLFQEDNDLKFSINDIGISPTKTQAEQNFRSLRRNTSAGILINNHGNSLQLKDNAFDEEVKNDGFEGVSKNSGGVLQEDTKTQDRRGKLGSSPKKFGFSGKFMSQVWPAETQMISLNDKFREEQNLKRSEIMNKIFGLDIEVQLAQKQDTYMYFAQIKGIKQTKQEVENKFIDHDLRKALKTHKETEFEQNTEVSLEQFISLTRKQNERYSRMIEFEFVYPIEKIKKKYALLQELSQCYGYSQVTVEVIKDYQTEKAKPFFHEIEQDEQIDQEDEDQDEESKPLIRNKTTIDITQVKTIFEKTMEYRLQHYKRQVTSLQPNLGTINHNETSKLGNILKPTFQNSAERAQAKFKHDPVVKKFNQQLQRQKLQGAIFKQVGIDPGDFTICLGDVEALGGANPYIDNSRVNQYFGEKYDDLEEPFMYPDQQMIIARIRSSQNLIILQFDRGFRKIIDGMICVEVLDGDSEVKYEYTHTFNNWIGKKKDDQNYYRRRYAFLTEGKTQMGFIQTKSDKEKDEDDRRQEQKIRMRVKERTEEQWYLDDKEFKKQVSLAKSGVSIAFGILEDIPQLSLQTLNSILIGQTMTWIQLLSPVASTISVFVRIYSIGSWDLFPESEHMSSFYEQKCQALCIMTLINLLFMAFCFLPIILIVMNNNYFVEEQKQLEWVEANFETIRNCEAGLCSKFDLF